MTAKIFPYIHFQGNCAEAMAYYQALFGGTDLRMMKYDDMKHDDGSPMPDNPMTAKSNRIMHAQMNVMGAMLMASDFPAGVEGDPQQAVSIMLAPDTVTEARRLFDGLKEGGVIHEFGPTFWSKGFGMAKDRFGTHWIIGAADPMAE